MCETEDRHSYSIPQSVVLGRLAQSEQMRDFFIQMWLQNPSLANGAGRTVREILAPASCSARAEF